MSRALYRLGKLSLMLGANIGVFRIHDFRLAGNKTPKKIDFLVVDFIHVLGAEETLFGH